MNSPTTVKEHRSQRAPAGRMRGGFGVYWLLLTIQTVGAAIVLVNGVPIYRQMASDFSRHQPQPGILWWAVAAVALIQIAYWLRVRLRLSPPERGHIVIGHLAAFIARLSFILASSTFTVIFFVRFEDLPISPQRILMLLSLLFSMFCWTLELERLAKALHGHSPLALSPSYEERVPEGRARG